MEFEYFPIQYECPETLGFKEHYVVIANLKTEDVLISHVNLYLREQTGGSLKTSRPAAINIISFYKYLSTTEKMKGVDVSKYHILCDNQDIKRWQVHKQAERVKHQKLSPSSETIYKNAKNLLKFFKYLHDKGYSTGVTVEVRSWIANFKSQSTFNYINKKTKQTINPSNIKALDIENYQKKLKSLITDQEIVDLMKSYPDPVYAFMFAFGLGTAIRVQEICEFPYTGTGANIHIKPYSEMHDDLINDGKVEYTIYNSKGKTRTINIPISELEQLEEKYTNTLYPFRKAKYKEKYGKNCPPSILFLDKSGDPVDEVKVTNATDYAKKLAMKQNPRFRKKVNFYENRHWWPTQVVIEHYGDRLLTEKLDVLDTALAETITNQMGHEDISTTLNNYIDSARVQLMTQKGMGNEIFTSSETALKRVERLNKERSKE